MQSRHHRTIVNGLQLRETLRADPYAWPGGYPLYFIASDGEALSFGSVRANIRQVLRSIRDGANDGWRVLGVDVNYEDPALFCAHSGERIPSAYSEE